MVSIIVVLAGTLAQAQRPPEFGSLPPPPRGRIEVKFALGEKTVSCRRFRLTARWDGRFLFSGKFTSSFAIPPQATNLPRKDAVELEFKCGSHRWRFTGVGERAFLWGRWWVGTDLPPFQSQFRNDPMFQDAVWIRYLITDPEGDSGFVVYKYCPAKFKDVKPGPCYTD
jgi:hypothetical protein